MGVTIAGPYRDPPVTSTMEDLDLDLELGEEKAQHNPSRRKLWQEP